MMALRPAEDRPRAKQTPAVLALLALAGLPFGVYVSRLTNSDWIWKVAAVAPLAIGMLVYGWRQTPGCGAAAARGDSSESPPILPTARVEPVLGERLLAQVALALGVGAAVAGSYYGLFWLVGVVGLWLTVAFWKDRPYHGLRGALPIVGVFVAAYGFIGAWFLNL
jgi:hypothetical protein